MPDQKPIPDLTDQAHIIEREILYALTNPDDNQPLWTIEDLARELDTYDVIDYANTLHRAGLIHRTSDGHIFASRAAIHQIQIIGRVV